MLGAFAPLAVVIGMVSYVIAGMAFDIEARGHVHPAYWSGAAMLILNQVAITMLDFNPPVLRLVARLAA